MERPGWIDSELYPFEDHWASLEGCTVHYVDEGSGPPLLMVHGNPTWSFTWRDVIKGVSDRFRCVAIDLPVLTQGATVAGAASNSGSGGHPHFDCGAGHVL